MAPIKPWCISPTSQREQSQPAALHTASFFHCFCILKVFLIKAAIKSYASVVRSLANVKEKRLCDQEPPHLTVLYLCCMNGDSRNEIWIRQCSHSVFLKCNLSSVPLAQCKLRTDWWWILMILEETGRFKLFGSSCENLWKQEHITDVILLWGFLAFDVK